MDYLWRRAQGTDPRFRRNQRLSSGGGPVWRKATRSNRESCILQLPFGRLRCANQTAPTGWLGWRVAKLVFTLHQAARIGARCDVAKLDVVRDRSK